MSVQNPRQANAALDALQAEEQEHREDLAEHQATRERLEQPPAPEPDDDAPATAEEADETPGYAMTEDRRVGSMALQVEGHGTVRFGKPSGRTSTEILGPVEEMDQRGGDLSDLAAYVWHTLAEWSLDDDYDADFWADGVALLDAVTLTRNLALGGNAPMR